MPSPRGAYVQRGHPRIHLGQRGRDTAHVFVEISGQRGVAVDGLEQRALEPRELASQLDLAGDERIVVHHQQQVAAAHAGAVGHPVLAHEALAAGDRARILRQPRPLRRP